LPSASLTPGLTLIHGNRAEALRDLLVAWMKAHPLAPLETETVLVQSNGVAQWLKLALAADEAEGGCGIAAATDFSLPSRFVWNAYRAVLGREAVPETSPFDKTRLVWRLMRLLPEVVGDEVYAPLRRYLDDDPLLRKRFQLAERLADLFDQYQVYRADWLEVWVDGKDSLPNPIDAKTRPLPADQRWQAALWRQLVEDVVHDLAPSDATNAERPRQHGGRAAVHAAFLERTCTLEGAPRPAGLPRRVLVFGIASLPLQTLEVLARIAQWSQVFVCVHNPCRHYWADIVSGQELLRRHRSRHPRKAGQPETLSEDDLHLHAHPLLAAWGKLGRDYIAALDFHDDAARREASARQLEGIGKTVDLFVDADGTTLLQQLQQDILELRPMPEIRAEHRDVDPAADPSLRFHVAHGQQREVEILHDQLLAAFSADPTLKPRDVIVMVPDIEAYAPHVQAVFGLPARDDPRFIPFSLADRAPRQFDPLVHALELLLDLPQSRVAASDVLDLIQVPALRARFGIDEDALPLLHRWIRGAGVRWGMHGGHRATLGLPDDVAPATSTWLFGMRRMLLGYATGFDAPAWNGIEPYGEIGGLEGAALGPLAALLERLEATWRTLRTPATVGQWCARLRELKEVFFAAADAGEAYTLSQLDAALDAWEQTCAEAGFTAELPLSVVAEHWLESLDPGGLAQRFLGGAVTFATLMPMRAIPFRHVCLLGMNDGDYPRARNPLDFDLMSREYRPGDRSRREDDRYLFLEALLSARERLYVSWVGRSINDNTERPPSVLVGQLRDHLRSGWAFAAKQAKPAADPGEALLAALTTEHPLQPFSPAYFPPRGDAHPAPPAPGRLFTYAREWQPATAEAAAAAGGKLLPALARDEPLTLRALADFLKDPVKEFFRQRLGVYFEIDNPATDDVEPFEPDGLARWQLQDELIRIEADARVRGEHGPARREATLAAIARRGELPPGAFGARLAIELAEPLDELFDEQEQAHARWPHAVADEIELRFEHEVEGQRIEVTDWLGSFRRAAAGNSTESAFGSVVLETSALVDGKNHYRGDKLIRHWVRHLALHVALDRAVTTVVISRKGSVELGPREPAEACKRLQEIVEAWREGMRRPLPLAVVSAFAWLRATPTPESDQGKARQAARVAYEGGFVTGERDQSAYLARAFNTFEALWSDGEFRDLAERLLRPVEAAMLASAGPVA
jgi:exodeoxyribonuclease V gamma subunit